MALGYYNFAPVMAGNQTIANSLTSLGQQIGQSIENHAQTQAAQAMLPSLQSQVQQGMGKIAAGDSSGLSDVYGAATSASQLPILAPLANHAITMANEANIQAQHIKRSEAVQDALNNRYNLSHPLDANGNPPQKPMTQYQQQELLGMSGKMANNLWNGDKDNPGGISSIVDNITNPEKETDPQELQKFGQAYAQYATRKANLASGGIDFSNPNFDNAVVKIEKTLKDQQASLAKKIKESKDPSSVPSSSFLGISWGSKNLLDEKAKVDDTLNNLKKIQSIGVNQQQPSSQNEQGDQQSSLLDKARNAIKNGASPEAVYKKLKQLGADPSALQQKSSPSMPPTTAMLPSVSGNMANSENEEQEGTQPTAEETGEV